MESSCQAEHRFGGCVSFLGSPVSPPHSFPNPLDPSPRTQHGSPGPRLPAAVTDYEQFTLGLRGFQSE